MRGTVVGDNSEKGSLLSSVGDEKEVKVGYRNRTV